VGAQVSPFHPAPPSHCPWGNLPWVGVQTLVRQSMSSPDSFESHGDENTAGLRGGLATAATATATIDVTAMPKPGGGGKRKRGGPANPPKEQQSEGSPHATNTSRWPPPLGGLNATRAHSGRGGRGGAAAGGGRGGKALARGSTHMRGQLHEAGRAVAQQKAARQVRA
jgi:hypothetical protein